MAPKLTPKEQKFVDAYMGAANGVAFQAVKLAGYRQTTDAMRTTGSRLLRKAHIKEAIRLRQSVVTTRAILNAEERDEMLSIMASDRNNQVRDRIRAIGELNKCSGRHSVKHMHEGTLTLEQILADSRK